jgi:hypothetical protein
MRCHELSAQSVTRLCEKSRKTTEQKGGGLIFLLAEDFSMAD